MSVADLVLIAIAGVVAGTINTVVGSGTLVTFPALLAAGVPPVAANVANNIGLAPGSVSGAFAYRGSLHAPRSTLIALSLCAVGGGVVGAVLLITLPSTVFAYAAPVFIGIAIVLVLLQPRLQRHLRSPDGATSATGYGGVPVAVCVAVTSAYGGYFGAGQGVILLALMTILIPQPLQHINAVKNVLQGVDNITSATVFVVVFDVRWDVVAVLATGAVLGGHLGGRIGQRLPDALLRAIIVAIGVFGIAYLVV